MKKIKKIVLSILPIISLASCGNKYQTIDQIKKSGTLIVATNAEFAPFEYLENNIPVGLDMDIIKEYAKSINVKCDIKNQDFDAALLSVSNGKADVAIAAITKNSKREESMSFSKSYYTANQVVIVKEDSIYSNLNNEEEILSALSTNKAVIGVQRGTTGQYYVEGDADWGFDGIQNTKCNAFDNGALAVSALTSSKIDAVIVDIAPAQYYCNNFSGIKYLDVLLTEEEYAIAVCKGNDSLVESLNEYIDTIKNNGTFTNIINKYFGTANNE